MESPTLVVMAAGMGSRFGGLKQLTAVDLAGHPILDFSLYDARRAGFHRVVFIIQRAIQESFYEAVGRRAEQFFEVDYVYQELDALPEGFAPPAVRKKPWGTGHAVACCREVLRGPFAVINADDFYGPGGFRTMYEFLSRSAREGAYAMLGYRLRNTLTENGSVSRGICEVRDGALIGITEQTRILRRGSGAAALQPDGGELPLTGDETVSMNFWGFSPEVPELLWQRLGGFLRRELPENPEKCEFFLPNEIGALLAAGSAGVSVLPCDEQWYGVTYREDLPSVREAVERMKREGQYPELLWE